MTTVFKDQCCLCFHQPEHADGLFICARHRIAFCAKHLQHHLDAGCKELLNLQRTKTIVALPTNDNNDDKSSAKKLTKLVIDPEADIAKYKIAESWTCYKTYPTKTEHILVVNGVGGQSNTCALWTEIIQADSGFRQRELQTLQGSWDGSARLPTKHVNLVQLDRGDKIVPTNPAMWRCDVEDCEKKENLWLNLTDGKLLCGRSYMDGSGGNDHALKHYTQTGYPLAVSIGTICPEGADVYSYDEDDMVIDPYLDKHLRHFNLDMLNMRKVEKTMLEKELDLNSKYDEARILEQGRHLENLYGSDFVGLHNLGNTCYMNSFMQALGQMDDVCEKVEALRSDKHPENPLIDFRSQLVKLFLGLQDEAFSVKPSEKKLNVDDVIPPTNGLRPDDFRFMVCRLHKEFMTKKQQDVEEFGHYFLDLTRLYLGAENFPFYDLMHLARTENTAGQRAFHKLQCFYDVAFPYEKLLKSIVTDEQAGNDVGKPEFNLTLRLHEMVERPETAIFGTVDRLVIFPRYMFFKVSRHGHTQNNRPCKFPYELKVDSEMDLGFMGTATSNVVDVQELTKNLEISGHVEQRAVVNQGPAAAKKPKIDQELVRQLMDFGVDEKTAQRALVMTSGDVEQALNLFYDGALTGLDQQQQERQDEPKNDGLDETRTSQVADPVPEPPPADCPANRTAFLDRLKKNDNGRRSYRLFGLISHVGTSTASGHYVCHVKKGDKWVVYNDESVMQSVEPPIPYAYVYIYERIDN